jgi:hypothetical protein
MVSLITVSEELPLMLTFIRGNNMKQEQLLTDLTDEQCEKVVGGVGIGPNPGGSAGFNGWGAGGSVTEGHALFHAGKAPGSMMAGKSGNNIIIPT